MTGRHITDYVDELLDLGAAGFRDRYPHAMLVRADAQDSGADIEFRTAVVSHEALSALQRAAEESGPPSVAPGESFTGEVFPIVKRNDAFPDQIGVGRARNVDVCVPLPRLSKYHGYFTKQANGTYTITDAGSTNGIRINAQRVEPKVPTPVPDGADLELGPYRFVFYGPGTFCTTVARRAVE